MSRAATYVFHGDQKNRPEHPHPESPDRPEPYVASKQLIEVVNQAIKLRRPLLLEGEAGCGKTRLAWAIAYELGLPLYPWYVRSTTKASQGLYEYDYLARLHEVQIYRLESQLEVAAAAPEGRSVRRDPSDPSLYYKLGPLGKAFELKDRPAVVLIDEIDKADLDFPNDLLHVLDEPWSFRIPEANKEIVASAHKPIVIITSNNEKGNLPSPFLRRCIYHFIDFPDEQRLQNILDVHYQAGEATPPPTTWTGPVIQRFIAVRQHDDLEKKPGTSEFLDWIKALRDDNEDAQPPAFDAMGERFPHPGLLFKLRADWLRYARSR